MIDSEQLKQNVVKAVEEIRATNPMAGSITNTVTIDFVANAQLAVGGSAAMVYLPDEGEALVAGGGAIYLNMGTLFPIYKQTIPRAAKAAHDAGKPWVLDPVGLGIGSLRTQLVNDGVGDGVALFFLLQSYILRIVLGKNTGFSSNICTFAKN